jgi:lipopolysaccharide transport system ATP-binding protein
LKPILEVRNLWKQYQIGGQQTSYLSLRERLLQPFQKQQTDTFWALQDINFDVYEGECIGIIGRNGAGKSTLLKILSQITPPTKGYIKARGRVASLLEVGTGFHPELTGRENVYLNGSILGLKRSEINAKFDEIIDFSGVEKFLDTPLKHYSSGMRLRLAFSVAAHLEPEILLIDEVLAVGDAEFQKKCLGKMDEVSKSGRTVIFVSHNLGAVEKLCSKSILLIDGQINKIDTTNNIIKTYLQQQQDVISKQLPSSHKRKGNQTVKLSSIKLLNAYGMETDNFVSGEEMLIEVSFESKQSHINFFNLGLAIYDNNGRFITVLNSMMSSLSFPKISGTGTIFCKIERLPFIFGNYSITATLQVNYLLTDQIPHITSFMISEGDYYGTGISNAYNRQGIYIAQKWFI